MKKNVRDRRHKIEIGTKNVKMEVRDTGVGGGEQNRKQRVKNKGLEREAEVIDSV